MSGSEPMKSTPGAVALLDQTNALLDDVIDTIEKHWPGCLLNAKECVGDKAWKLIIDYVCGDSDRTKALLFVGIIRATENHMQVTELRDRCRAAERVLYGLGITGWEGKT